MDPMSLLWSVLRIAIGVYLGLLALLWLFQERLLFYPQPLPDGVARMVSKDLRGVTELEVDAGDGVRLRGWLRHTAALAVARRARGTPRDPDVLALHGQSSRR